VLLDECVPRRLAQAFGSTHSVATVTGLGWAGTNNGDLLHLAAANGFDVLVTVDVRMHVEPHTPLAVVTLRASSNRLEALLPLMPRLLERLPSLTPGHAEVIAG
jgi:hypothetical protein